MSVIVTCGRCGKEYESSRAEVLAGTWRRCPDCRDPEPPLPDERRAKRLRPREWQRVDRELRRVLGDG